MPGASPLPREKVGELEEKPIMDASGGPGYPVML
jgi:hypothetical protein